eukprot:3671570-Prymnesium_polylepis.1
MASATMLVHVSAAKKDAQKDLALVDEQKPAGCERMSGDLVSAGSAIATRGASVRGLCHSAE